MHITLCPQRRDDSLSVSKLGDILTINGEPYNFDGLSDGETIPAGQIPCSWIVGQVERVGGDLRLSLVLPLGANPTGVTAFPDPIVNPPDGVINVPFDEWRELVSSVHNGEGVTETYVIHRWRQADETVEVFIPDAPEPVITEDQIQEIFTAAIRRLLNGKAAERGYDDIHTGSSYRGDPNPAYDAEGQALFEWRSAVWTYATAELAKVLAGQREIPDLNAFLDELPRLTWPA